MADGINLTLDDLELEPAENSQLPLNLKEVRDCAEHKAVLRAMTHCDNNVTEAANALGITRPTLYNLLDKYNSSGAISKLTTLKKSTKFTICDGGTVGVWKKDAPQAVEVDGGAVDHDWNESTGLLTIRVQSGCHHVRIVK